MPLHLNDAGTWRQAQAVYVNDAGTWRAIQEIYVNDAGTWRSVFTSDAITISDVSAYSTDAAPAVAVYSLTSAGDIVATQGDNTTGDIGDWITPQINMSLYESRATAVSGTPTTGTMGAWQSLATTRSWTYVRNTSGVDSVSFTLEIRRASDGTVLDTATITLEAEVI